MNNIDLNDKSNLTTNIQDSIDYGLSCNDICLSNVTSIYATTPYISNSLDESYFGCSVRPHWNNLIEKMGPEKLIQLSNMMKELLIAKEDFECYKSFITFVVSNNVCPEDFILENIEYLTPEIILKKHQDLIASGKYQDLKLYIMAHN